MQRHEICTKQLAFKVETGPSKLHPRPYRQMRPEIHRFSACSSSSLKTVACSLWWRKKCEISGRESFSNLKTPNIVFLAVVERLQYRPNATFWMIWWESGHSPRGHLPRKDRTIELLWQQFWLQTSYWRVPLDMLVEKVLSTVWLAMRHGETSMSIQLDGTKVCFKGQSRCISKLNWN